MVLVVGAQFQGKLSFALQLSGDEIGNVAYGATCSMEEILQKSVIADFHLLIKRMTEEQLSVCDCLEKLLQFNPEVVVVADEIAYGFTENPLELEWRKQAGTACRQLAAQSKAVYHLVCGIPTKIKGE